MKLLCGERFAHLRPAGEAAVFVYSSVEGIFLLQSNYVFSGDNLKLVTALHLIEGESHDIDVIRDLRYGINISVSPNRTDASYDIRTWNNRSKCTSEEFRTKSQFVLRSKFPNQIPFELWFGIRLPLAVFIFANRFLIKLMGSLTGAGNHCKVFLDLHYNSQRKLRLIPFLQIQWRLLATKVWLGKLDLCLTFEPLCICQLTSRVRRCQSTPQKSRVIATSEVTKICCQLLPWKFLLFGARCAWVGCL